MANRGYMPQGGRRIRSPSHPFHIRQIPFVIQPICFAPVQAGETLKNLTFQARLVTDPIKNGMIGWWAEVYWFYVKLSDVVTPDQLAFMYNPGAAVPAGALNTTSYPALYNVHTAANGQIKWAKMCYDKIVNEYFRSEDEKNLFPGVGASATGLWLAQRVSKDVWDSAAVKSAVTAVMPTLTVGVDDTFTASEIQQLMRDWELARAANLTAMTWDDYLLAQGVNIPQEESQTNRPELLRYQREWQYPSNTVEPTTGVPSSAVSWAMAGRADKDRFFKEPGFVVGLTVIRPKVYLKEQQGSLIGFLNQAERWLPSQLAGAPEAGFFDLPVADGVADNASELIVDLRDLFEKGEQFLNFGPDTAYFANVLTMQDQDGLGRYPVEANLANLFTGASAFVRMDGVADLKIATHIPPDSLEGVDAYYAPGSLPA